MGRKSVCGFFRTGRFTQCTRIEKKRNERKKTQTQTNKQQKQESIFKRIKIEFNVSIWIGGRPIVCVCVCERVDGVASTTLEDMTHKSNHSITAIDASAAADTESY